MFFSSSTSTTLGNSDCDEHDGDQLENYGEHDGYQLENHGERLVLFKDSVKKSELEREVGLIMDIIRQPGQSCVAVRNNLEKSSVSASPELVTEVLSQVQNHWELAFTFFLWADKKPDYAHSLRQYHSMIAILGKMRRFDTAWTLIDEMKRGGKNGDQSMVTPQTLLIMIRRYSAVHDVGKAINTFYAYKRFNFEVGIDAFHDLLSALCRYKNVKEAENLMLCNKDVYPLTTKSFNIILNGWCNIIVSPREGKRIWWEMCNRGIHRDVISYSTIITCYSKSSETKEVIKIYNELKATGISPDRKVYNGMIHALAKAGFVEKARDMMKSMEQKGISPNAITYNSLIMPLCKCRQILEARDVFDEMLQRGLLPTVRTYHAFFRASRTGEEAFSLLKKMTSMGCCPNHDTYIMLIRKFCHWGELENVSKLWNEMISNGLDPDRSSYVALIHGLFLSGMLEEAYKYHLEMKAKGLLPEPEIEKRLQAWMAGKPRVKPSNKD
ncbi:Pentatricopeptide repeat-containing protein [Cynara cardunculus var. scolymus]|uniref:Pentatricopeptide repeat-containing protein n=2 Tax=Cynara cardunculus var. scolymus TaxID=59895 RepID=A0A103XH72_CYNCS|nr:Pentatricopeptide repeat-containing protein [Cynara cardunculus var. scolymus]